MYERFNSLKHSLIQLIIGFIIGIIVGFMFYKLGSHYIKGNLKKKIDDYLAIYNKDKGFAYIFSNDPGLMYYKDNAYDITADVIKGLNEAQSAKK